MSVPVARPKIALFGVFGAGNLGNEWTLEALLFKIRELVPLSEITCICSGPAATAAQYGVSAVSIRGVSLPSVNNAAIRLLRRLFVSIPLEVYRWLQAVASLRDKQMLVMTGTGMLGEFGISPFDLHYDIFRWSVAAKLCRCKLLFVSVGVGPLRHPLSRQLVKAVLAMADFRSYRDTFSRDYLESIGFRTNSDPVYPDLAFNLPKACFKGGRRPVSEEVVIGVGLMSYFNKRGSPVKDERVYRDYLSKMASFVICLLERKYTVRLLIGDLVYDRRVRQDIKELLELRGVKYGEERIIDEPASSLEDFVSQLAETDVVVASRFHNVLLGLIVTKLVVAISYHEKIEALMAGAGLTEFCQDIEDFDVAKLIDQVALVQENAGSIKHRIGLKTEYYRQELDRQYEHIFGEYITADESAKNRSLEVARPSSTKH